jgi:hypothetical protein
VGDRHARLAEHTEDGIEIVEEEVAQQRQRQDLKRWLGGGEEDGMLTVMQGRPG